ncbi:MAG: glycosyltransferase family 1 protein [Candidatus Scalindua sp. AMX11]|nr:MAG: glycosyltransferase family 1 protein [Candidatus Scalindua sp.]NOG82649.1 glycosyltransferase family 4 protein [Planctomycetota bacterium]RZV95225.1 MAG: glycosyltransferase family 1 protein [Candidatus Scalindua sp. SCAELEC01]TDE66296.1 MAG: glycosyltransferase family 1 protein [Candidatus Scalindua sp. AMX11]GJQ57920.1 MAG: glycosyl transferase [Candidatus Scalindua sp.]
MRVLFLIQGMEVAASRYRVLQYLPFLQEHGVEPTVLPFPKGFFEKIRVFKTIRQYDILFIQRKRFAFPWLQYIRKNAKQIVFDFDDSIMHRNSKANQPESKTRARKFEKMVTSSDYVIAGNAFLMEKTTPYKRDVMIIPSPIDMSLYSQKNYSEGNDTVTLGWIGAHGSIHYMKKMTPLFEALGKKYDRVKLKIVCDVFFDCENMVVEKKLWSEQDEVKDIQSFDIGLMPLIDDPWSHGKCGLKILQCLAAGVPVVCSPFGINREIVEDGVHGLWAESQEEWVEKLEILINNKELREKMGRAGRKRVSKDYSLETHAPRMLNLFKRLVENSH